MKIQYRPGPGYDEWTSLDETLPPENQEILRFRRWSTRQLPTWERCPQDQIICVLEEPMRMSIQDNKVREHAYQAGDQFIVPAHSGATFFPNKGCTVHFPTHCGMKTVEVVVSEKEHHFKKYLFRNLCLGKREAALIFWDAFGHSDCHDHSDHELQAVYDGALLERFEEDGQLREAFHKRDSIVHIPKGRVHIVEAMTESVSMMYYYNGPVAMNILHDFTLAGVH